MNTPTTSAATSPTADDKCLALAALWVATVRSLAQHNQLNTAALQHHITHAIHSHTASGYTTVAQLIATLRAEI